MISQRSLPFVGCLFPIARHASCRSSIKLIFHGQPSSEFTDRCHRRMHSNNPDETSVAASTTHPISFLSLSDSNESNRPVHALLASGFIQQIHALAELDLCVYRRSLECIPPDRPPSHWAPTLCHLFPPDAHGCVRFHLLHQLRKYVVNQRLLPQHRQSSDSVPVVLLLDSILPHRLDSLAPDLPSPSRDKLPTEI